MKTDVDEASEKLAKALKNYPWLTEREMTEEFPWLLELDDLSQQIVSTLFQKEATYRGSWQARGGIGAFMMLARKWDRIESGSASVGYDIFEYLARAGSDPEDDIRDLIGYLLLVLAMRRLSR
jgi:hypothetical protein